MRTCRLGALVLGSVLLGGGLAFGQARLGPYVVDSNGLKVGHAVNGFNLLLFISGEPLVVRAGISGFTPLTFNLYFMDGACGGQAYLDAGGISDAFIASGYYTTDGVIHYFAPASIPLAPLQSAITVQTDGTFSACGPYSGSLFAAPALNVSVSGQFTPPFSVVDTLPVTPAPGTATFNDVPTSHPFFQFIEALYASGITAGCQAAPPLYCPDNPVTRGQMAVFLAKALGL